MAVTVQALLEAGVHFGHQTKRWNPKMAKFIFTQRSGIYIIDLQKTKRKLDEATAFMAEIVKTGKPILFVGTKRQAQQAVKEEAERTGQYFVNERWLGGMLTNHQTISKRIARLSEIERMEADGVFEQLTKKETMKLRLEYDKLNKFLGGIRHMKGMPAAIVAVDPKKEKIAIHEARILGIPTIGIVDTNADPDDLDYPIPANDDAIRSIKLVLSAIGDAIVETNQGESFDSGEAAELDAEKTEGLEPEETEVAKENEVAENNTADDFSVEIEEENSSDAKEDVVSEGIDSETEIEE